MFGSQALETAIGLATMFFILATAASTLTEVISRWMRKRAVDLDATLKEMLTEPGPDKESRKAQETRLKKAEDFFRLFKLTSVWQAAESASGRTLFARRKVGASYLSAKSFADAIHEALDDPKVKETLGQVPNLTKRLDVLEKQAKRGLLDVKAGLETWFDETMNRAEGAYKRWAALVLFCLGLALAVVGNASTTDVARELWQDTATREAVVAAASNSDVDQATVKGFAGATDNLSAFHLPVGWDVQGVDAQRPDSPVDFIDELGSWSGWFTVLGWLLTAALVMLGGPFWFDLLTKLVALRSTGTKPTLAAGDNTSATALVAAATAAENTVPPVWVGIAEGTQDVQGAALVVSAAAPAAQDVGVPWIRALLPSRPAN